MGTVLPASSPRQQARCCRNYSRALANIVVSAPASDPDPTATPKDIVFTIAPETLQETSTGTGAQKSGVSSAPATPTPCPRPTTTCTASVKQPADPTTF
jgi:hypothetical protein